ncbi:hypothetical protein G6011_05252 [Alternaria panax]|uniref:Uncharacterized protein n=1 Tax=Alternaria panax TaxID=48097 RepID=A0AAD4FEG6_9PLEO|nr:hypothetical protein G6011_05252 [Alternaria panax]
MVLSILIAAIVAPGLLGSQEAIRQSQSKEKREEHRARRCNLIATCVKSSHRSREIDGRQVVLRNGKLWIDTGTEDGAPLGHPYAGYYLPYPETNYEGLVTTITDVAPIMNWVYIDRETCEVRYGVRADAQPNLTGPFDCTRQDRRLTFDGWEGWCAVEEAPGLWGLYFDLSDDGLKSSIAPGTRVLEIELSRKEKRFQKETEARQQDQTTKRSVDAKEDAPVDQPLAAEALVSKPGVVDEKKDDESGEQESYRPMKIPKSIFEDPPPVVESLVFRPATPPPAYSPAAGEHFTSSNSTAGPSEAPSDSSSMGQSNSLPITEISPPSTATKSVPAIARSRLGQETEDTLDQAGILRVQPPLALNDEVRSIIGDVDSPSAEQQSVPTTEKRTIPKLNRSSGSRALAQAQKFEAMASAQNADSDVRSRSNERGSRANSTTSSLYSNEGELLSAPGISVQPQVSPTPAPLALAISKANQAKALATRSRPSASSPASDPSVERPITPPGQRALSLQEDSAVPRAQSMASNRPVVSLPRRPNASGSTPSPSTSSQRSTQRPGQIRQRRERSGSEQSSSALSGIDASRSSPRSSSTIPGRQSLARTMTSGKGNQGMSNRIGGSQGRANGATRQAAATSGRGRERSATTGGRKTTSALFREIDDLVSLEGDSAQMRR